MKNLETQNNLFTPEGIMMLMLGAVFDFLSIICAILVLVFGIGLILSKIIYIMGLIFFGTWQFFRSGNLPIKKNKKAVQTLFKKFFKRYWKKLAGKFVPIIGDLLPFWTIIVYSELKKS